MLDDVRSTGSALSSAPADEPSRRGPLSVERRSWRSGGGGTCRPTAGRVARIRFSSGGCVAVSDVNPSHSPWAKNMWLASAALGACSRRAAHAAPIRSSAPARCRPGLRVNCTAEASARYSRCRETAALIRLPIACRRIPDTRIARPDQQQVGGPPPIVASTPPPRVGRTAEQDPADQAQKQDAVQHADQANVQPHVAVEDVAEFVGDHALQLVAVSCSSAAAGDRRPPRRWVCSRRQRR